MVKSFTILALAVSLSVVSVPAGAAQMVGSALDVVAQVGDAAAGASVQSRGSGLPARTPPPRTMSDQWPVFAAFTLVWLALVGYTLSFNGRLKRIAASLAAEETRAEQHERSTRR